MKKRSVSSDNGLRIIYNEDTYGDTAQEYTSGKSGVFEKLLVALEIVEIAVESTFKVHTGEFFVVLHTCLVGHANISQRGAIFSHGHNFRDQQVFLAGASGQCSVTS